MAGQGIHAGNRVVLDLIKSDFFRYSGLDDFESLLSFVLEEPGFRFSFFLRLSSVEPKSRLRRRVHRLAYRLHKRYFYKYAYQIPVHTRIGEGFQIIHFGALVINELAVLGRNCTVFPGTVIGQDKFGRNPEIGDNCWIGFNSIIVGDITIGSNCLIAPGSYVNFDVPSDSLVMGNPGRIIAQRADVTAGYLNNLV